MPSAQDGSCDILNHPIDTQRCSSIFSSSAISNGEVCSLKSTSLNYKNVSHDHVAERVPCINEGDKPQPFIPIKRDFILSQNLKDHSSASQDVTTPRSCSNANFLRSVHSVGGNFDINAPLPAGGALCVSPSQSRTSCSLDCAGCVPSSSRLAPKQVKAFVCHVTDVLGGRLQMWEQQIGHVETYCQNIRSMCGRRATLRRPDHAALVRIGCDMTESIRELSETQNLLAQEMSSTCVSFPGKKGDLASGVSEEAPAATSEMDHLYLLFCHRFKGIIEDLMIHVNVLMNRVRELLPFTPYGEPWLSPCQSRRNSTPRSRHRGERSGSCAGRTAARSPDQRCRSGADSSTPVRLSAFTKSALKPPMERCGSNRSLLLPSCLQSNGQVTRGGAVILPSNPQCGVSCPTPRCPSTLCRDSSPLSTRSLLNDSAFWRKSQRGRSPSLYDATTPYCWVSSSHTFVERSPTAERAPAHCARVSSIGLELSFRRAESPSALVLPRTLSVTRLQKRK